MESSERLKRDPSSSAFTRWFRDNPALTREWSQRFGASRRPNGRLESWRWAGVGLLLLTYFGAAQWLSGNQADPWTGRQLLVALCGAYLVLVTGWVPAHAASSIAWEREQETWQQLLLTRLRPSQLVAAKVLTALWPAVCLFLGVLPLLLPALHAARLPLDTAFELLAILVVAPVPVTVVGVWLSLRFRKRLTAVALAYVLTGALFWGLLACFPPFYVRGENLWWYLSPMWQVGVLCLATPGWGPLARPLLPEWVWFGLLSGLVSIWFLRCLHRRITTETG